MMSPPMAGETTRSISATASATSARDQGPGAGGPTRFGEIQGALEIIARVETRGQQEVSALVGTASGEVPDGEWIAHWSSREMS